MLDFLFLLFSMRRMPLILFTVTCGLLLFLAFLAIDTIWWWSMISHTTLGLFLYAPSLRPHWRRAMEEEYAAVLSNQTWDLVPRPSGCNVVTGKWIWTHKRRAQGFKSGKARRAMRHHSDA